MKTNQLINIVVSGSTNFITTSGIKKIIKAITVNEHLELYDRYTRNLKGIIDLKLETQNIKLENQIGVVVERILKAANMETLQVAQV